VETLQDLVDLDEAQLGELEVGEVFIAEEARTKWIPEAQRLLVRASSAGRTPAPDLSELRRVQGIGHTMARWLESQGITHLDQLAALKKADVATLQEKLAEYPDRITTERWVKQARALMAEQP
jgi:predicted flap endonuclease-1-like 5' DNA nuclease